MALTKPVEDLIVSLTPTGMVPTKEMTSYVPITPEEIAHEVCSLLGSITMVHIHARDERGQPTHEAPVYGDIIGRIRNVSKDLIICVSLSGRSVQDIEKRAGPILKLDGDLKPDMGSLTLSSLNFVGQASMNSPVAVKALAAYMKDHGVMPELEAFDVGMINYGKYLIEKGFIKGPRYWNLFLGNIASAQMDLAHAGLMLRDLPAGDAWSFGGIGDAQLPANAIAIAMGGGVRVGLEDSIYWIKGDRETLASNTMLVTRVRAMGLTHGRSVMPPATARRLLGLEPGGGRYGVSGS